MADPRRSGRAQASQSWLRRETLDAYTRWCREELFNAAMMQATELLERACDLHLVELYRQLDLASMLSTPRAASDVARELGYVESADITLDAMLWRLSHHTPYVVRAGAADRTTYAHGAPVPDRSEELARVWETFDALGPAFRPCREFIEFGATHFETALRDDPDLLDRVLSGREKELADFWYRATNEDPLQNVHGVMGARAILDLFEGGRVLEIGGGTGNGIRNVLDLLARGKHLDRIERYIFTDIGLSFIMSTKRDIQARYPDLHAAWQFLDINKTFGSQKIEPGSVDLVYGVNAAHVARDIVAMLQECHKALRPGGMVLFAERVRLEPRTMAPRELTLNLSIYHRTAAIRHPEHRPTHCYLTSDNWLSALERAGFVESAIVPNVQDWVGSFPHAYAIVVVARRD